ncbi:uncharacterized protein [Panulirus ornatus]|uniref:uncharacterized protein n=1 Tax=Panulirus ornatus TaxID=150431 RepID=UPI003A884014
MRAVAVTILLLGSFTKEGAAVECYKCSGGEDTCGQLQLEGMAKMTCGGSCYIKKEPKGLIIARDCNPFQVHADCTENDDRDITCYCNVDGCNSDGSLDLSLPLLALAVLLQQLM